MIQDFENKTAVLTGGASGFGLECARLAASLKMNVVLVDVQQDALDKAEAEIKALGVQVMAKKLTFPTLPKWRLWPRTLKLSLAHLILYSTMQGLGRVV